MMQLWVSDASPFARKARMAVIELDLGGLVEEQPVQTGPLAPNETLTAQNPLGKIPCLIHEQGFAIFDSRVICRYLDDKAEQISLHPSRNYKHETLIALADGIMEACVAMVYEGRVRPEDLQFSDWVEAQWAKAEAGLRVVERDFMDILARLNMGAIGVLCAVEFMDLRLGDREWRKIVPELADWHKEFSKRPSAVATKPKG